jgi:uncharacterized protein YndB with AHSA1/START domain
MMTDVSRVVGAVTREISTVEKEGRPARVLVAERNYDTSIDDLWDALTNAERIPRWFLPVSGDLRAGGHYQLQGNASGQITRCEPPHHLELTWEMQGMVSWVVVQLSADAKRGTMLRLEHIAHVPDELWNQFGPGAAGVGWDQALFGLERHLSTGASVRPEEAVAWLTSAEGRAFVRQSSDAWRDTSIAAGTDPAAARAAANRTTAFYTGAAPEHAQS